MSDALTVAAAIQPSPLDIDTAIHDVAYLTALGQWIESARRIVDDIESCRRFYPEVDELLRGHDVRSGLDWDEEESNGLQILLRHIRQAVAELGPKREEVANG